MYVHTWDRSFDALDSFIMVRWGSNPKVSLCSRPCSAKRLCNNSVTMNSYMSVSKHLFGKAKQEVKRQLKELYSTSLLWFIHTFSQ